MMNHLSALYEFRLHIAGPAGFELESQLPLGATRIGRDAAKNELPLPNEAISGQHAEIHCSAVGCSIKDLGSTNHTWVNTRELPSWKTCDLSDGDKISIKPFTLTFKRIVGPAGETLLKYLPVVYHADFMKRFLALFEEFLLPLKWTADNFDLFLDPRTAPADFLPWLAQWFEIVFDPTWTDLQRRVLLSEAGKIYARLGTPWALSRVLEIYTGHKPEIIDDERVKPFVFIVKLPIHDDKNVRARIEAIIDAHKPAYTGYTLLLTQ